AVDVGCASKAAASGIERRERSRTSNPLEGGDKRQWRRKPRAGRRRPARNGKLTSPVKKKVAAVRPFSIFTTSMRSFLDSHPPHDLARLKLIDDLHARDHAAERGVP